VWWSAVNYGTAGVAAAWTIRAVVEAGILFVAADRLVLRPASAVSSLSSLGRPAIAFVALVVCALCGSLLPKSSMLPFACAVPALAGVLAAEWTRLLSSADRDSVLRRWKSFQTRLRGAV